MIDDSAERPPSTLTGDIRNVGILPFLLGSSAESISDITRVVSIEGGPVPDLPPHRRPDPRPGGDVPGHGWVEETDSGKRWPAVRSHTSPAGSGLRAYGHDAAEVLLGHSVSKV